jgi:phospholipid-translocating ATPase
MSTSHQYHQPNAPDPSDDDNESDLDLEFHELGPASASQKAPQRSFDTSLPLRALRSARQQRRYADRDDDGDEDTQRLLEEGHTESGPDDDAPLLQSGLRKKRRRPSQGTLSKLSASLLGSLRSEPAHANGELEPEDEHDPSSTRTINVGQRQPARFPVNVVSNSRYTPWSFLPLTLYNEFKFFINIYFLLVALSQLLPALRIGYIFTYILPLVMVLTVTLGKEAWDDIVRRKRDTEANSEPYTVLVFDGQDGSRKRKKRKNGASTAPNGNGNISGGANDHNVVEMVKPSRDIKVGDIIKLGKNQRVPADLVLLRSVAPEHKSALPHSEEGVSLSQQADSSGEIFIRTDQLDGETDWKLRIASPLSQNLSLSKLTSLKVMAGKPDRKVNEFVGTIELSSSGEPTEAQSASLSVDNTAWANTVIASNSTIYGVVVYTGSQTRQALSTTKSRPKVGLLELEINNLTKILCALTLSTSLLLVLLGRIEHQAQRTWYIATLRFLILFSTVIPISLRVNLDMGKIVYAWYIEHDNSIPETIVRTSTIPEDLGRIEYLLSDKTGTLTQNEMALKKIHVGTVSYASDSMDEVSTYVNSAFGVTHSDQGSAKQLITPSTTFHVPTSAATRIRREIGTRVRDLVLALALCHNVTPTFEDDANGNTITTYQASSPDEIAIVRWTEAMGLRLIQRDRTNIVLESAKTRELVVHVKILNIFPFTSEGKRMGVVVQFARSEGEAINDITDDSEIWFYQKGADTVMSNIVLPSDWLDEETANLAREGFRTLVVGRKKLSTALYRSFSDDFSQASLALHNRDNAMSQVIKEYLERDLELLGVTGVEDKLQQEVQRSLELLRNAGIKIWMLTGDKVETAKCVAISSKLVARGQFIHTISKLRRKEAAAEALQALASNTMVALVIDGESLAVMLAHHSQFFVSVAAKLPAVIACRVSPIQKADLANLIKNYSGKRICCIGDGGNDVSMIQAADVGVGIVGKEGKQASLAADYSILQFRFLTKLLVWHGRNSYKRSAKLSQFVIHRGVIMSVCQVVFSVASKFGPNALYRVSRSFVSS